VENDDVARPDAHPHYSQAGVEDAFVEDPLAPSERATIAS
jgi:hypothetical protein